MRVAMFSWESMHSIAIGGIAPHVTELSAALVRLGHEVHVFTRVGLNQSGYDFINGVHYHRCPFVEHADFVVSMERMSDSFVWHLGETEHYLGRRFDVVHGHDWMTSRALTQVKNERRTPTVMTVHSTEFGRCGNSVWDDEMSGRIRAHEWEGTFVADRVICVSRALARETQRLYAVPADKVDAIYNGINVHRYDDPVDVGSVRRRLGVGIDDPMILFAGRVTWQKGPDILLDAIPQVIEAHPRAIFVFAGDGDMRAGLEMRAQTERVAGSTRFLGFRNGSELIGLFKSADLICVPSRNEPFGIVILEAWSATKPVVATRAGGPEELVTDEQTGLMADIEAAPIALGINRLADDAESARFMGRNGRREVETRFSWDHAAVATLDVYRRTLVAWGLTTAIIGDGNGIGELVMARKALGKRESKQTGTQATQQVSAPAAMAAGRPLPTQDQIRERAYALYVARGRTPGDPLQDWLSAERELIAELAANATPARKTKAADVSESEVAAARPIRTDSTPTAPVRVAPILPPDGGLEAAKSVRSSVRPDSTERGVRGAAPSAGRRTPARTPSRRS